MWWSVHQPQWGSPELRHSPQVVYCSQDSTGTRDTCKGEAQPQRVCRHGGQVEPGAQLTFSACAEGCGARVYGSRIKKTLYNSEIKPSGKTSLLLLLSDPLNWCTHNAFTQNEGKWKGKINGKRISWG